MKAAGGREERLKPTLILWAFPWVSGFVKFDHGFVKSQLGVVK